VSALEATAVLDEAGGALTLFAVNRGADALRSRSVLRDLGGVSVAEHIVLAGDDLDATNTAEAPDRVAPVAGQRRERRGRHAARGAAAALLERAAPDRRALALP
jgi:alpha-N-arabinofuranosidase